MSISFLEFLMYIVPAGLSFREIGRIVIKGDFALQLTVGLGLVAGIVSPIYYWQVQYVRPIILLCCLLGAVLFLYNLKIEYIPLCRIWISNNQKKQLLISSLIYIFVASFLFRLKSNYYVFENHDVLYFGWIQEAWSTDYVGGIRVPTEFPAKMAANHLLPGIVLSSLGILLPSIDLVKVIDLRYFFIVFIFSSLLIKLQIELKSKFTKYLVSGIMLLMLFGSELAVDLMGSSFLYVVLLLCILKILFTNQTQDNVWSLFIFFILLTIAKAPIFHIAGIVVIYLLFKNLKSFSKIKVMLISVIALSNIYSWVVIPKPRGLGTGIPLPIGFNFEKGDLIFLWSNVNFDGILGWYVGHEAYFVNRYIQGLAIQILCVFLILTKIYGLYFFTRRKIGLSNQSIKVLDIYMVVSALSILGLRNNGELTHQAHAFLLASVITYVFLCIYVTKRFKMSHLLMGFCLSLAIQFPTKLLPFFEYDIDVRRSGNSWSLSLSEVAKFIPNKSIPIGRQQVYFSMIGERLKLQQYQDYSSSQVHLFIQEN